MSALLDIPGILKVLKLGGKSWRVQTRELPLKGQPAWIIKEKPSTFIVGILVHVLNQLCDRPEKESYYRSHC